MALVAYDASDDSGNENESESIFSSLPSPKVQTTFAENPVEAPVTNKSQSKYQSGEKKRAKITVPSLSEFKEEDSEPSQKKAKQFKSGLFSVLPPPQNSSIKNTNRNFIPYTLTKRPNNPVVSKPSVNPKPVTTTKQTITKPSSSATRDSEDEDDEGPVDFFSLSDTAANSLPEDAAVSLPPIHTEIFHLKQEVPQASIANLPASIYANPPLVPEATAHPQVSDEQQQHLEDVANDESQIVCDDVPGEHSSWVPMNDADILQDEGFLRLQGKRPKGGRMKDDITIIDVSQDDQLPSASERQSKALTQETEYRPRRKGGAPTSQQRRKHQITYLAFQAREREYELKNQWAENRMTRKQTQSKYGF